MDLWKNRNWTPMLLGQTFKPFNSKEYLFEIKFDGIRAIVYANSKIVKVYNRHKKDITYLYPELQDIKHLVSKNVIFDGEIVVMNNGIPSFSKLQERAHLKNIAKIERQRKNNPVIFVCFDILYEGKDLTNISLEKRKKLLDSYEENDSFIKTKYTFEHGIKLYNLVKKINIEGIVAKKRNSIYEFSKRSDMWLKIKNLKEESFFIGGFIEKERNYVISLLLGEYQKKEFIYVGKVTLGKKTMLYKNLKKAKIIKNSPFNNYKDSGVNYVRPNLSCKVNYMERTQNNSLRQPFISHN